jgi:DNA-3-methyladenine glycosylase II
MPVEQIEEPTEATEFLQQESVVSELIEEHGYLQLTPANDTFQRFVRSIVSQQVSTDAASAIQERLFSQFEVTPEGILDAEPESLKQVGLSRQKVSYVRNLAVAYRDEGYGYHYFAGKSDDEVISELTQIKGVGVWTAKMYLQFCLAREDVFPVEDLGIRRAMESLYDAEMTRDEMVDTANDWKPYRSIASLYLWRTVD